MKVLKAEDGKVFAFINNGEELVLSNEIYLGKQDNPGKYYQINDPTLSNEETDSDTSN